MLREFNDMGDERRLDHAGFGALQKTSLLISMVFWDLDSKVTTVIGSIISCKVQDIRNLLN